MSRRSRPAIALSDEARGVFLRLRRKYGELTATQQEILALFSLMSARHARACEKLREEGEFISVERTVHGRTYKTQRQNPWLRIAETCERKMIVYLRELLQVEPNKEENSKYFEELLTEQD